MKTVTPSCERTQIVPRRCAETWEQLEDPHLRPSLWWQQLPPSTVYCLRLNCGSYQEESFIGPRWSAPQQLYVKVEPAFFFFFTAINRLNIVHKALYKTLVSAIVLNISSFYNRAANRTPAMDLDHSFISTHLLT